MYTIQQCRDRKMICRVPTRELFDIIQKLFDLHNGEGHNRYEQKCREVGGMDKLCLYLRNDGWGEEEDYSYSDYSLIINPEDILEYQQKFNSYEVY